MVSEQEIIEEELVYGALRRERLWQRLGLTGLIFSFFTVHFVALATESGLAASTAALFFGIFLFLASDP